MDIGSSIRKRREEIGISQAELAKRLGKSKAALCKIEKGVNDVNTKTLAELASVLECSIADLLKEV